MFRKSSILTVLLPLFIFMEVKAQTTTTINASVVNSIVRYKDINNQNTFQYTSLYQIGRKDGSNGYYSGSPEDIYRSQHSFSLGGIPSNATLSQVKLIYFVFGSSSYKFMVTQTSGSQSWGNLWGEIGTASALESDINYGSSSRISSSLLSAVNSARSSGVIYLGALSQNESTNLTEATVELRLEVTYTVPPAQANITAQNNFGSGTIKVGINAPATQRTSPYPFTATVGNTVNLEAQEQSYGSYNWVWSTSGSYLSKWEKVVGINRTQVSTSISYSFTAADNDNNSTYEAGLRKVCNITFQNYLVGLSNYGTLTVNGQSYNSPTSQFPVVEQNAINVSANTYYYNNYIEYNFSQWNDGNTSSTRTFYPNATTTYTANYIGKPTNSGKYAGAGAPVGQPIVVTWTDNPNTAVNQFQIWRKVKHNGVTGNPVLLTTIGRGVQTYTDYDYLATNGYTDDLLWYDVRAYYSTEGTYSDPYYVAAFGRISANIDQSLSVKQTQANEVPTEYSITNYPNPFNPTTTINYQLPENGFVTIKVYDMLGKEVATLVNENKSAGYHTATFDASKLTSGVYVYTITANNFIQSKKMILMK